MIDGTFQLQVGQWLWSAGVGAQGVFFGKVVRVLDSGDLAHLTDVQGRIWARRRVDLSLLSPAGAAVKAVG